ncbi:hypothetical protein NONI108955_17900 [Nocardia ninae]|uniref:Uncharacterized protein n=2 Tax=Nocardia ninae TaxID=356145 RepID=A0A511MBJ3_9NOCA|nr:hypothetical protein NN4_23800 [Nocardia ninae NBRC 108245]
MGFVALPSSFAEPGPPGVTAPPGAPSTQPVPLEPDQQSRVYFKIPVANEFVRMQTRFTVPPKPARVGTMFLWPGLEPREGGRNYYPIGLGVLQPVLTWGPACAPVQQPPTYSTWWISGQYVNVYSNDPRYRGCHSGRAMSVQVGEVLEMDIALDQSTGLWTQTITGQAGSVRYSINLRKQAQNMALFAIEPWDNARLANRLVFSDTTLTFRDEAAQSCLNPELTYTGTGGTISPPTVDGRRCHIDTVTVNVPRSAA